MLDNPLYRSVNAEYLDIDEVARIAVTTEGCEAEIVLVEGDPVPFSLDLGGMTFAPRSITAELESELAILLHEALIPARKASPALLMDTGVWTWIGLDRLREYVVARWCGGRTTNGGLVKPEGCSYFLTGHSLADQTRCAPRRLWIAANTSQLADGNYTHVGNLLKFTDLYTGIFERMIGLDAELAVEIASQLKNRSEDDRRKSLKLLGALLSTTALEFLDRRDKANLVSDVIDDLPASMI